MSEYSLPNKSATSNIKENPAQYSRLLRHMKQVDSSIGRSRSVKYALISSNIVIHNY